MKTQLHQLLRGILFAILLTACHSAFAFFDPTIGTFISRDPIEERGGLNVYGFVGNQPITRIDLLGKSSCECGRDVTAALSRTLGWVDAAYANWSLSEKRSACNALYDITSPTQLQFAWDILPLEKNGFGVQDFGSSGSSCARTVTFAGKCYYGGAVNYALWGHINKLCWMSFGWIPGTPGTVPGINNKWSLPYAVGAVGLWKTTYLIKDRRFYGDEETEAAAFTVYGYTGILPSGGVKNCKPNSQPVHNYAFQWRWLPVRNPDNQETR